MKTGFVLLTVFFCSMHVSAQSDLISALGKGDIDAISSHIGDKVEMTIRDKEEVLSRSQAVVRLREFYAAHPAKGFKMVHTGNSKGRESYYQIGELSTDKGNFRVYLYFTVEGAARTIAEMRFEQ